MGSSDKDTGVVGCSVGSIVWVRRRNGSWWPGKILGAEELSAAHLMSPRSGTPVKLLGREDASVDWYNLEKSKRVKAFRCGEFDDCIEMAETSLGMPPKKREKYARREDAILHALELEKKLLEEQNGKSGCSSNGKSSKSSDPVEKEFEAPAECLGNDDSEHMHPKSEFNKLDSSIEDHPLHAQKVKEESLLAGDEDNSEVNTSYERCLETSRQKLFLLQRGEDVLIYQVNLLIARMINNLSPNKRRFHFSLKRATFLILLLWMKKTLLTLRKNTETDTSATDSLDSEADEEMMALSDAAVVIELEPKSLRRSEAQVQHGSMSSEEPDGLALASDKSRLSPSDPVSTCGGYLEDSRNYFDPVFGGRQNFGGRMKSQLVDVDLKVQSSYQREHVPMISLMSKLNGQAIVGHPIQIEALENGSSEMLLSAADGICPDTSDNDTALPPMWRTARRTANFRVPRAHPSATLDGEETVEHFQYWGQDKKVPLKKSKVWSSGYKASTTRKSLSHAPRPPLDRKYSRKPPKKISLSSSQKIKTLSSIGTEQKLGHDLRHGTVDQQVDGLIKEGSGPTTVACIPVKLVYSRLYEELVGRRQ
ncbi:Tudor/PWWP/MBT superfamily protein [Actinidia rufa]|uniref:Tudor/PWWP/MBT superfamily protein n=1 Tax=Actinidia rufa TaxID=165716 RepID=A0A7J0GZ18_9ERIC|nr:Tudor/PWWP/MBT superfamily protein [Actinidia rufa]